MASAASLGIGNGNGNGNGNGGVGSSRSAALRGSSSSVDWLGREMLQMRLRDNLDHDHHHDHHDHDDDDRVSSHLYNSIHTILCILFSFITLQESEPDIIDGVGAETGHVIRTSIGGRNGQSKQVIMLMLSYTTPFSQLTFSLTIFLFYFTEC